MAAAVKWLRAHPGTIAYVLIVSAFFWGRYEDSQNRAQSREESCAANFIVFDILRTQIAQEDVRFQSGAYDKIFPAFASPEVKRISHESAVRRFDKLDNSKLPFYCSQRDDPETLPNGFKR